MEYKKLELDAAFVPQMKEFADIIELRFGPRKAKAALHLSSVLDLTAQFAASSPIGSAIGHAFAEALYALQSAFIDDVEEHNKFNELVILCSSCFHALNVAAAEATRKMIESGAELEDIQEASKTLHSVLAKQDLISAQIAQAKEL